MKRISSGAMKNIFKKGDLILVAVLLVAVALTIWLSVRDVGGEAEVYIDGELKYVLDLSEDTELVILDGKMTIEVENGEIYVKDSDCPEQLCVQSAHISSSGGMIVCLPNKVVIKIASREVDAIS